MYCMTCLSWLSGHTLSNCTSTEQALVVLRVDNAIQGINNFPVIKCRQEKFRYPLDGYPSAGPQCSKDVYNAIHRINRYPVDKC